MPHKLKKQQQQNKILKVSGDSGGKGKCNANINTILKYDLGAWVREKK